MITTDFKTLIDSFLNLDVSDQDKQQWVEKIELHRQGFDSKSALKLMLKPLEFSDNKTLGLSKLLSSEEEYISWLKNEFNNCGNESVMKIQELCSEISEIEIVGSKCMQ